MSVKFMIDSASDISEKEANELGVIFMPIEVRFDSEEFMDGINITPKNFYNKLEQSSQLPKTSLINEYRWEEAFKDATADGSEVVAISISSGLSGGYASAFEASKKYEGKVFVVDSLSATIGERLLLQRAMELEKQGFGAKEIAEELDTIKYKLNIVAMVGTLKYLKMGGRISATTAFVGEMLSIKPLISVIDGKVKQIGKTMGTKKAFAQIKSIVNEKEIDYNLPCGMVWSGTDTDILNKFVGDTQNIWSEKLTDIQKHIIGCTIGTHVGPGAVGIAFFEK